MPQTEFGRTVTPLPQDDTQLIQRIGRAYRHAVATPLGSTDSMWLQGPLLESRRDIHEALVANQPDTLQTLLRSPGLTNLFHGFEDLSRVFLATRLPELDQQGFAFGDYLGLLRLCEAVGVRRLRHHDQPEPVQPEIDDLFSRLDRYLGITIDFPNPFPDEIGLATSRGVASNRAFPAIYQAWRIWQLVGQLQKPRVLEIGGGLGRTAYYAQKFGITNYTIIDIPTSSVAQANFLGRTIGLERIQLYGEEQNTDFSGVRLLPPAAFLDAKDKYDLVLNVDSLTEMARDTAQAYCNAIDARVTTFLSINHEGLSFTARDLIPGKIYQRSPYWMRAGYAEELSGRVALSR